VSSRQEPIDRRPGRLPRITKAAETITFDLDILVRPERVLRIQCDRDGEITLQIFEGKAPA
jgi:hypothetical protein